MCVVVFEFGGLSYKLRESTSNSCDLSLVALLVFCSTRARASHTHYRMCVFFFSGRIALDLYERSYSLAFLNIRSQRVHIYIYIYYHSTIIESGPKCPSLLWFWGPSSIVVDPLGS